MNENDARDRAVRHAKDILEMDFDLQAAVTENTNLRARVEAAAVMVNSLKQMVSYQTGARYSDRNIITAYADQAIAVIEGRAPVTHTKAPDMFARKEPT